MTVLTIDDDFKDGIFAVVSAVLHIGNLVFADVVSDRALLAIFALKSCCFCPCTPF
jgi:myosin heavy subunit